MNDLRTEDDLLAALDELGRDAPTAADVLPSTGALVSVSRWRTRRWAPVAAAAVVVALAIGLAMRLSHDGSPPKPPAAQHASRLVGVHWEPTSLASRRAAHRLVLEIEPNGRFWQNLDSCSGLQGQLSIAGAQLKIQHVRLSYGMCPGDSTPNASQQQRARALTAMLTGTVSWSIRHSQLTLRKHGVETITYSRPSHSPAQTRQWTFHGVGITVPASWPANAVRCSTPITNTVTFHAISSACAYPRPPGVTAVHFSPDDPNYDPFPTPPPGDPTTIPIDGVDDTVRSTDPSQPLQIIEVQIPSREVTVTITSPSRTEAFNLEQQLYLVQR